MADLPFQCNFTFTSQDALCQAEELYRLLRFLGLIFRDSLTFEPFLTPKWQVPIIILFYQHFYCLSLIIAVSTLNYFEFFLSLSLFHVCSIRAKYFIYILRFVTVLFWNSVNSSQKFLTKITCISLTNIASFDGLLIQVNNT